MPTAQDNRLSSRRHALRMRGLGLLLISLLSSGGDGRGRGSTLFAAAQWDKKGYIELTKDGYRVTSAVLLEEGLNVDGDVVMSGNWR